MTTKLALAIALLGLATPAIAATRTACEVLTKTDFAAAQGQEFSEAKLSTKTQGALSVSQCFYRLPAFEKSVSVTIMRPIKPNDRSSVRDYWNEHYAASAQEKREDRDDDRERTTKSDRDEEDHHAGDRHEIPTEPMRALPYAVVA